MAAPNEQKNARRMADASRDFQAAYAHDQAGRRDRAEALYRKVLQKVPDHPDALNLLGIIAHERGRHGRAIQLIERALAVMPEFPAAHVNLGNALWASGRRADAAESYRRAIALMPGHAVAHCNLAAIENEQGAFAAGLADADRAIELMPDLTPAYINRANALIGQRRSGEAEAAFLRALELIPDRAETHSEFGSVLADLGRFDEAVASHQRAIALRPADALLHRALGTTLLRSQQFEAAEASCRRALSLAPELAKSWLWLGNTLVARGGIEEAMSCFRRGLAIDPDLAEGYEALAFNGQSAGDEAQLERLAALLADPDRLLSDRIAAGFALGNFLDEADRYDEAFAAVAEANALRRRQLADGGDRFDPGAMRNEIDGVIERCTPAMFSAAAEWGNPSELPVFIVGMPRSGTSLVEQIAASHSRVFGAGERKDIGRLCEEVLEQNRDRPIEEWDMDFARRLADEHIARLQGWAGGAARVTDKLPDNIFQLGIIAVLFPAARVIFCRRDARDTCVSCYFQRFAEGNAFSYDLGDCGRRLLETERLAECWRRVLPLSMLTVDYEALIADPEGESRHLIEFLGLDWEPACLDFHRTERPVFTSSMWQVRQPIYHRSVGRWRHYQRHLEPLFEVLAPGRGVDAAQSGTADSSVKL
jgi:tetratricopeptide (TPR) repeat protein